MTPRPPFVLLDDSLTRDGRCFLFEDPVAVVRCDDRAGAARALREIAAAADSGLYAAGFLSYELGYLLEPVLADLFPAKTRQPLIWMGLFPDRREIEADAVPAILDQPGTSDGRMRDLRASMDRESYIAAFDRVKRYIAAGDVYQVNLTFRYDFAYDGDPLALYGQLRDRQNVAHGALVAADDFHVLSFSPELFLRTDHGLAEMRPMKGTAARGRTLAEDSLNATTLREDQKSRAENLMILDLMRNDLGRVAEVGSVEVTDLFTVETYRTLLQMTSGVTARLRADVGFVELVRGLFPCGSVTGAPKIRAMEIIRELEPSPRGVYTGAVGMLAPNGDVHFNVAIRTMMLDAAGRGEMGIGSGIVFDSDGPAEYQEALLKARFATDPQESFQLIETLRWRREDGYYLLDLHLARLADSAAYFGYRCELLRVTEALEAAAVAFEEPVQRVRLTLDRHGHLAVHATAIELPDADGIFRYIIADARTRSSDPFLFHKTTNRRLYDETRERLRAATGCDEAVFMNERGELTEGSYTTLFVEREGRLLTPPLECGVLNGTLRRALFDDPKFDVAEAVLRPEDLESADRVYLGNSVRGLVRAEPVVRPSVGRGR